MRITRLALRRPITVLMLTLTLIVLGVISLSRLKISYLPDVDFPFIGVFVPYPNAIPSQVERDIAKPLEEILATLGDIDQLFSESRTDGCFVGVTFKFGRQVDVMRLEVKEKIDHVRDDLPSDVRDIFLFTFNSNDIPILVGRISAKDRDLASSFDLLERKVIKPFERIDGVGRVQVDGIAPREVSIYLKMDAIKTHAVDVGRLFQQLQNSNINLSVGKVTTGGLRYNMRTLGAFRSSEELANMEINDDGLRLSDIADVVEAEPEATWYRRLNGESAIAFEIQKASGANTVEVSRAVHRELERINRDPALSGVDVVLFFDQAADILDSLRGLLWSGLIGSGLAILVLFFFLRHLRTTLVVSIAIPFSLMATCAFLYLAGKNVNLLTMMGLMLAVGMLVDNAIVVIESIFRQQVRGKRGNEASAIGTGDVGVAVTASTLTSVIVFAPIVLGGGDEIIVWLKEVGVTLSVTLLFSLLVSLTLVPLMAARLSPPGHGEPSGLVRAVQKGYLRLLRWTSVQHPVRTLFLVLALIPLTIVGAKVSGFGMEAFGDRGVKRNRLRIGLEFQDNVNVYKADEYVARVEEYLLPRADSLDAEIYSFFMDNRGEVTLFFDHALKEHETLELRKKLRAELPEMAGVRYRLGDDDSPNKGAQMIQVSLFGEDSDLLNELALEVKRRLALLDGFEDVRTGNEQGQEEVQVIVNREAASRFGVNPSTVSAILNLTFRGTSLRDLQSVEREIPVDIVLTPEDRRSLESLKDMTVNLRDDGRPVLLGQVADFEFHRTRPQIVRESQRTSATVRASFEGKDFGPARKQVEELMNSLALPAGYNWSFGRDFMRAQQEKSQMLANVLLALACVYFVMAALFESLLHPLVIMSCVPFAIFGVIWLTMLTGTPFNIMAMIGVVVLVGVVVNNGIVLVAHINQLRREGLTLDQAILEGGRERFRPILMTAATTVLGLLPLALGQTAMADAMYYPMARALIGGLLSGTLLTLVVLPTFYVLAERQVGAAIRWLSRAAMSPLARRRQARLSSDSL